MQKLKIAVFVSGNGSNLQTLIDAQENNAIPTELPIEIVGVISNRQDAYAIERAKSVNIPVAVFSHAPSGKRLAIKAFEKHSLEQLNNWQVDLVILAGFMRVLSADFISNCPAPMINLHPSLLPKYKGLDTHARAIEAGDTEHGCSVHIVTAELDAGQVLTQAALEISVNDDAKSLQKRVQKLEHQILPHTVAMIAQGIFANDRIKYLDTKQTEIISSSLPKLPWKLKIDT